MVKSFDELWEELGEKKQKGSPESSTVDALDQGTHFITRKILEEAGEVFAAANHETNESLALEISQLIYWLQVLMLDKGLEPKDIYERL